MKSSPCSGGRSTDLCLSNSVFALQAEVAELAQVNGLLEGVLLCAARERQAIPHFQGDRRIAERTGRLPALPAANATQ